MEKKLKKILAWSLTAFAVVLTSCYQIYVSTGSNNDSSNIQPLAVNGNDLYAIVKDNAAAESENSNGDANEEESVNTRKQGGLSDKIYKSNDGKRLYQFYYLGRMHIPLSDTYSAHEVAENQTGQLSFKVVDSTRESISNALETAREKCYGEEICKETGSIISDAASRGTTNSVSVGVDASIKFVDISASYGHEWEESTIHTEETTIKNATGITKTRTDYISEAKISTSESALERADERVFVITPETKLGFYRYVAVGNVDVYGILEYDTEANKIVIGTYDLPIGSPRGMNYVLDYSSDGSYTDRDCDRLSFMPTDDEVRIFLEAVSTAIAVSKPVMDFILVKPAECALDSGFSVLPSEDAAVDSTALDFDFGKIAIRGASLSPNGDVIRYSDEGGTISFKLNCNCDSLPLIDKASYRSVANCTWIGNPVDMPGEYSNGKAIKKGLLVAHVSCEDGYSTTIVLEDVFNGKKAEDEILIANGINKPCTIDIVICFEIQSLSTGFLGKTETKLTDWRINQRLVFEAPRVDDLGPSAPPNGLSGGNTGGLDSDYNPNDIGSDLSSDETGPFHT